MIMTKKKEKIYEIQTINLFELSRKGIRLRRGRVFPKMLDPSPFIRQRRSSRFRDPLPNLFYFNIMP